MKRAKIVIGANYGDEGKGLMTDYFCREAAARGETCLNVLINGGPQRGHTVVTPEGMRHIFHHLGSGSFAGADTYFSDVFLINPMIFREEYEELRRTGADFRVFVHLACRWTTPYDMILNQMAEEFRGSKRHGSCGFGIWETVLRYRKGAGACTFGECDEGAVREVLIFMRDEYLRQQVLRAFNWSRYQLGKKGDKQGIFEYVSLHLYLTAINVHGIRQRLQNVKGDPNREQNTE